MNKKKRAASISDVAKAAGVSSATVSRVFNKRDLVHSETRDHVLAVAKKLGFELSDRRPGPKPAANEIRPLIRFLHFLDLNTEESPEMNMTLVLIKRGVEAAAEEAGFRSVYNIYGPEDNVVFLSEEGETGGIVLLGNRPSQKAEETLRKYPCCWVMTGVWNPDWGDQVMPDHREVGRLAAHYLASNGHKHVALLRSATRDHLVHRLREEGFACEMRGNFPDVQWSVIDGGQKPNELSLDWMDRMIEKLSGNLENGMPAPSGVFFDQDRTLFVLYPKLERAGLVPGENLEIISCNNMENYRRQLPFEYKSIDIQFELIGRLSVAQLLWRMKNPKVSSRVRPLILPRFP